MLLKPASSNNLPSENPASTAVSAPATSNENQLQDLQAQGVPLKKMAKPADQPE
jgi:hypothetical protein